MKPDTLEHWERRGWKLDPSILEAPGEVINTGGGPYYVGEEKEVGYSGGSQPLIVTRYCVGMKLGRPLTRNELVRYRGDKKDFRLSNLVLHSKGASAADLYRVNGDPIPGYSHCLCGCGETLDLERQKTEPHAYVFGHSPKQKEVKNHKRARPEKEKVLVENLARVGQPLLVIEKERAVAEDPMKEFRALFEKMIHNLPWEEFKELLQLLLEIQTREKGNDGT